MVQREFKLAYYDNAVQHIKHDSMKNPRENVV